MTVQILVVSKIIFTFQFNYLMSRFRNVYRLKHIYLRIFGIQFSAVSYGTYGIEAFVNLTFHGVKQLEGYGIFLTLLIATYSK